MSPSDSWSAPRTRTRACSVFTRASPGLPCCASFCARMRHPLPRWTGGGPWSIPSPTTSAAFPVVRAGQRPQWRFRGLLRFHSRCSLRACSASLQGPLSQGFAVAVTRLPFSGFPAPDSYRGVSTELLGWDFHPLERCTLMAHPTFRRSRRNFVLRQASVFSRLFGELVAGVLGSFTFPTTWRVRNSRKVANGCRWLAVLGPTSTVGDESLGPLAMTVCCD